MSSQNMKISVITICLNAEKTLAKTIESVAAQSYRNFEHIIIDGGSTDGTLEVIKEYSKHIDVWTSEPDEGISDAFNKGIEASSGDVVAFLNADDWYELDTLDKVSSAFKAHDVDVVYGNVQLWEDGEAQKCIHADADKLTSEMTLNHQAIFMRRRALNEVGYFRKDFKLAMDYELLLRLVRVDATFHYLNEILANMTAGGVSHQKWAQVVREFYRAKQLHFRSWMNVLWLVFQLTKVITREVLVKLHITAPIDFYHEHLSKVKKVRSL